MTAFSLDEMTSQLQSQTGMPYDRARRIAEVNLGMAPASTLAHGAAQQPATATIAPKAGIRTPPKPKGGEKAEQQAIVNGAIARGAFVYSLSQSRETNQTPGIPDLYLVWPDRALWFEVKTTTGVLSQAQARFATQCARNGTAYAFGTHKDFLDWCSQNGVKP